ncbi:MAG: hypothetical protein ACJ77K_14615 [Bacteroidia bacterium]
MFIHQIGLVSLSKKIKPERLAAVGAALQKQAIRDLGPIWGIKATVDVFPHVNHIPVGYWPIIIKDKIDDPEAAGYHTDKHGQPFSLVAYSDDWSITCSHEMLEMLVDPFGNRLVASDSIVPGQGRAKYLVEVCDPSEDDGFGYNINGERVSDFYTPEYFDPVKTPGTRYSYTGFIKEPKQILKGGYLSWQLPSTDEWWQASFFGKKVKIENISTDMQSMHGATIRSKMDRLSIKNRREIQVSAESRAASKERIKQAQKDNTSQAKHWLKEVERAGRKKK